jgi:peptide/nickel transport system substrate-binding protein
MLRSAVALLTMIVIGTACAPASPASSPSGQPGGEAASPATPKRITVAIRGDPKTLSEPINMAAGGSSSAGVRELETLVNAGLLNLAPTGELRPLLAEAAPTLENGQWKVLPDGTMETIWKLKPNLVWQDGSPITVDDFLFTSMVARDRTLAMVPDQTYTFLDALEAPDAQTLRATWKGTFIDADKLFTQTSNYRLPPLPRHLLETVYQEDRVNFVGSPFFSSEYVGAGAYRVKEWMLGSNLILEANERYVLGRPKIDQIEVRFILDTNTMVSNVLAGAVQLTLGRGLTPEQAITVRDQWKDGAVAAGLQNTTALFPQFINPGTPLLTDVRFRRVLLMSLDRQQMVETFMANLVPVADSLISPDEPDYEAVQSNVIRYPHDPRQAMEMLDSMGLARGQDGFYVDPSTNGRVSVEVRTRTHDLREKLQQVIAAEWGQIGIVGQPLVVPEQRVNDREYQSTFPGFYFRFAGAEEITSWRGSDVPVAENNYVGRNVMRYRSPEYDGLIQRYVSAIPRAERVQALGALVAQATDQLVPVPLYHEPEPILISNRLVNAGGRRGTNIQTWNAHEWDLKS